jgi:hypothetical protein
MRSLYYILDGRTPIACSGLVWGLWSSSTNRSIARTEVGGVEISTVFFGLNRQIDPDPAAPPLLFETMILEADGRCWLDSTWEEAEARHREIVAAIDPSVEPVIKSPLPPPSVPSQPQQRWELRPRERRAIVQCGDRSLEFRFSELEINHEVLRGIEAFSRPPGFDLTSI